MKTLVVFSHLRWNFVFQRPQHLLTRLARHYPVVFFEEPVRGEGPARLERSRPAPGVEVLCPHTPVDAGGFHDDQLPALEALLAAYLAEQRIDDCVAWFYTPMALPLLADMQPRTVVYDCMDELAAFKHAPRQMRQRETALLKTAQVVLTGGPSLYEAKRALHPHVLCLPSAVDADHYAAANALAQEAPMRRAAELQRGIRRPRLGFFGVIDERLDLDLVAGVADAQPDWQIVMVGPVVKIGRERLPQRPNIHWLGQQPYDILPQLVAGWDVCLMPFALNDATRYISPTKTLEYMACSRPSVSTSIRDVVEPYGHLVSIADTADDYTAACEAILRRSPQEQAGHAQALADIVARTSWDATAREMGELIAAADRANVLSAKVAAPQSAANSPTSHEAVPHLAGAAQPAMSTGLPASAAAAAEKRASAA